MFQTTYSVSVPAFSGPLDLLLRLIEREELDITQVSLAQVTEQYIKQIANLREGRVEGLVDFLVMVYSAPKVNGEVAQSAEQRIHKPSVVGSSPTLATVSFYPPLPTPTNHI